MSLEKPPSIKTGFKNAGRRKTRMEGAPKMTSDRGDGKVKYSPPALRAGQTRKGVSLESWRG